MNYYMFTQEIDTERSPFSWPVEDEAGTWESLDRWPTPLAGVRIDGNSLCLEYRKPYVEGQVPLKLAAADFKMLADFADLSIGDSKADGRLVRFAASYGGLGLCEKHGWPFAHTRPHCASDSEPTADGQQRRERIADWLLFSRLAHAVVVAVTSRAKHERHDALVELQAFIMASRKTTKAPTGAVIPGVILRWLRGGELRLWFRVNPPRLTLYGVPPLWTAIGLELATLAVGAKGMVLCSVCGRFEPTKHPRTGPDRRSYCSKHRIKGRNQKGVADWRERVRRALALRREGRSIDEIAGILGVKANQVKTYLAKGA